MSKPFAKLFERSGHQVLVTLDEDEPAIAIKFRDDNCDFYVTPKIRFSPKEDGEATMDAAWDAAEKAFDNVTEESAFAVRAKTLAGLNLGTDA